MQGVNSIVLSDDSGIGLTFLMADRAYIQQGLEELEPAMTSGTGCFLILRNVPFEEKCQDMFAFNRCSISDGRSFGSGTPVKAVDFVRKGDNGLDMIRFLCGRIQKTMAELVAN